MTGDSQLKTKRQCLNFIKYLQVSFKVLCSVYVFSCCLSMIGLNILLITQIVLRFLSMTLFKPFQIEPEETSVFNSIYITIYYSSFKCSDKYSLFLLFSNPAKFLGVYLDNSLRWSKHKIGVCKKVNQAYYGITRIKNCMAYYLS